MILLGLSLAALDMLSSKPPLSRYCVSFLRQKLSDKTFVFFKSSHIAKGVDFDLYIKCTKNAGKITGGVDFDFLRLPNTFRTKLATLLFFYMENKISCKIRFPFTKRSENEWPFEKFINMIILFSKLFFKIEKRKAEFGDCFSFF